MSLFIFVDLLVLATVPASALGELRAAGNLDRFLRQVDAANGDAS